MKATIATCLAYALLMLSLLGSPAQAGAPEPDMTALTTESPTPVSIETASPALTPEPTPQPQASPAPGGSAADFTYGSRLVEDVNANGVRDDADRVPRQSAANLVPWANPTGSVISLITAEDGHFAFKNLPPGDYSLRLYWPGGFVSPQASDELPDILRGAFRVNADGTIGVPDPLPETWPGLPEPFDVAKNRAVLGPLPGEILLNKVDPNVVILSPGIADPGAAVGEIDVGAYLSGGGSPSLPTAGARADDAGSRPLWIAPVVLAALLALGASTAVIRRRRQR